MLAFTFSIGRGGFFSAAIWSKRGFTKTKNTPASAPPLSKRNSRTPAMIHGTFDFFFASAGGGNGADDVDGASAGNGADGEVTTIGVGGLAATSPVVRSAGCSGTGGGGGGITGGGGGGGVGGGVAGREISDVAGDATVGPVVGPVLRGGNATVAG